MAQDDIEAAVENGVFEGVELAQDEGIDVDDAEVNAAFTGVFNALTQVQEVSLEQVQAASTGATYGALLQNQYADVEQIQAVVEGASTGAFITQIQQITVEQHQFIIAECVTDVLYEYYEYHPDDLVVVAEEYTIEVLDMLVYEYEISSEHRYEVR